MFKRFFSAKAISVNLLPKDPFTSSPLGQFLSWALSAGRYIVIFTELVVIGSFFARFWYDQQLTSINRDLYSQVAVLQSFESLETRLKVLQARADFVESVITASDLPSFSAYFLEIIPPDMYYDSIQLSQSGVNITGRVFSQASLQSYVDTLEASAKFSSVSLDQIRTTNQDSSINFIVRAQFPTSDSSSSKSKPKPSASPEL